MYVLRREICFGGHFYKKLWFHLFKHADKDLSLCFVRSVYNYLNVCQSWPKFGYQVLTMTLESLETWELENLLKLEKIIFRNEISSSDYFIKFWNGDTHSAVIISNMDKYQNQ